MLSSPASTSCPQCTPSQCTPFLLAHLHCAPIWLMHQLQCKLCKTCTPAQVVLPPEPELIAPVATLLQLLIPHMPAPAPPPDAAPAVVPHKARGSKVWRAPMLTSCAHAHARAPKLGSTKAGPHMHVDAQPNRVAWHVAKQGWAGMACARARGQTGLGRDGVCTCTWPEGRAGMA